jgi:hypothetical protein
VGIRTSSTAQEERNDAQGESQSKAPENTGPPFSGDQNMCPVSSLQKLTPDAVSIALNGKMISEY